MTAMLTVLLESAINKWKTLPDTIVDLRGRTVIITGSNAGLGLEGAKRFYAMNPARLILAVRTISKGEEAKRILLEDGKKQTPYGTANDETNIEVWALDLSSFDSVRQFARKCDTELERIDILLENAGVRSGGWSVTKDGWEPDLQVNVISTFLLAALLAPLLAKTAKLPAPPHGSTQKPHLVIVASDTHYFATLRAQNQSNILAAMNDQSLYVQSERYADTKALDVFLTEKFAKNPLLEDVVVCSVNPGLCRSEIMREIPHVIKRVSVITFFRNNWPMAYLSTFRIMYALFARTATEGSKTYTWASLENDIPSGAYTSSCTVTKAGGVVGSKDADRIRSQVWKELAAILIKEAPETERIWNF